MKRMLFNATQAEELRVAIVDGQKLLDLDIESANKEQRKSNIYKGVINSIAPSLEACFVDYGAERSGFLPFKEVNRAYFKAGVDVNKARIQDALKEGQEVLVQVDKDERGNKGAALTTFISLAGRYIVLMPNNPRGGGVSRRVEGEDRAELREAVDQLEVPQGMSVIARTAGIGRDAEELKWDLTRLVDLWNAIDEAGSKDVLKVYGTRLLYSENDLVSRVIRDHFHQDIGEILVDTDEVYEQARIYMNNIMPQYVGRVKLYSDDVPLFSRFQIEHQIESAYSRQVTLPSGGAIVIDHTEALVSVDVNSARATRGADIEETAFRTNLEAAEETARQLRLRDLGGLIVIDFIDMESARNQREVENILRDSLRPDRARVQIGKISRFGLMELSRQRLRPALAEGSHIPCPRCHGIGHIRGIESTALHILRILQEEAMKENTGAVHAQVPVDVATYLLNEKRAEFHAIESRLKVNVVLIPNIHLETPNYTVTRLKHEELNHADLPPPSYQMMAGPEKTENLLLSAQTEAAAPRPSAVVKASLPSQPAPIIEPKQKATAETTAANEEPGIISKIFGWFKRSPAAAATATAETSATRESGQRGERGGRSDRGPRRGRSDSSRRDGRRDEGRDRNQPRAEGDGAERNRSDRNDRSRSTEPRDAREPREPREARPPREGGRNGPRRDGQTQRAPRSEQVPASADGATTETQQPEQDQQAQRSNGAAEAREGREGGGRGRRRRGRGGRDRAERTGQSDGADTNANETSGDVGATAVPVIESPVAAATEIIHAEVPGGEMRSVEPVAHVAAAAPVEAEVRVEAAPVVVLAQIQAEVQAQVQHQPQAEVQAQVQHQPQAEAVVLAAPVITETPVVATPYTSVASEERVVEFTPPLQVVAPVAPVAPQPLVLPDGLDQIETDTEKLHRAASKVADAAPPRPPRVRPALPVISNEPLVQVETGR
jgi:ribonuclease E